MLALFAMVTPLIDPSVIPCNIPSSLLSSGSFGIPSVMVSENATSPPTTLSSLNLSRTPTICQAHLGQKSLRYHHCLAVVCRPLHTSLVAILWSTNFDSISCSAEKPVISQSAIQVLLSQVLKPTGMPTELPSIKRLFLLLLHKEGFLFRLCPSRAIILTLLPVNCVIGSSGSKRTR